MIRFEAVSKVYASRDREHTAVDAVTLELPRGQVFGVIGASGAGKSTLVRLINGLERPSSGRVVVDGADVLSLSARDLSRLRQRIGMIFQHFGLLSSKTAAQNIAYAMTLAGGYSAEQIRTRVAQLLERVGLSDHANKYPAQLSGGQKQRVGIARALANSPDILLCDEATSALDPEATHEILKLIHELNQELGLTVVLITHEMDVVRQVCDQVAVMDQGRVIESGAVADVFLHPKTALTRQLLQADSRDQMPESLRIEGGLYRLTFYGARTLEPVLSDVFRALDVRFTILSGRISQIKTTPYGQLHVALSGPDKDAALSRLTQSDVIVEALA